MSKLCGLHDGKSSNKMPLGVLCYEPAMVLDEV